MSDHYFEACSYLVQIHQPLSSGVHHQELSSWIALIDCAHTMSTLFFDYILMQHGSSAVKSAVSIMLHITFWRICWFRLVLRIKSLRYLKYEKHSSKSYLLVTLIRKVFLNIFHPNWVIIDSEIFLEIISYGLKCNSFREWYPYKEQCRTVESMTS